MEPTSLMWVQAGYTQELCLSICLTFGLGRHAHHGCETMPILTRETIIKDVYKIVFCSIPLPSVLGRRRRNHSCTSSKTKSRVISWDRNIVCLPACYTKYCSTPTSGIAIPRKKKSILAAQGLIGKVHRESDWNEDDVFNEIRSVFSEPMGDDAAFTFDILQLTGAGTKSLVVPALSSLFKWTPKEVAGRADSTVYILCKKLKNEVSYALYQSVNVPSFNYMILYSMKL